MVDKKPELPEFSYAARRQRPEVDPALRRIALAAGGVSVLVIAVAMLWSGVRPHVGFGPPPEITAPATPLRVAPSDPGGLTVPGANVQIMSGDNSSAPAQLAPEVQAPQIAQLDQSAGITPPAAPVAPAPAPPAPSGPAQVQLGSAVDQAGAQKIWSQLETTMPGLLTGKAPQYVPAVVDGQTIWRLLVAGFADTPSAQAFCAALVAKNATCQVTAF